MYVAQLYVILYVVHVCMYVAQLVRVCNWRLATSGTFVSKFKCGRATYISFLEQGTNIKLPQFCPSSKEEVTYRK